MKTAKLEQICTRIWLEEPEPDNPFAARQAFCHGYDVFGEMLGKARWVDMLYLLMCGEAPEPWKRDLLETVAVALANPGPRDPSVHAAMCGGVGGSTAASCLMAALGVGAGRYSGGQDVLMAMEGWNRCGTDCIAWQSLLEEVSSAGMKSPWPETNYPPGFDPHGISTATIVRQCLECLADLSHEKRVPWLAANRRFLEETAGFPISMSGVIAAAFCDLGFTPGQGEMLYLLLRLPGAAAHALEQWQYGHKKFPFYQIKLMNDPAGATP